MDYWVDGFPSNGVNILNFYRERIFDVSEAAFNIQGITSFHRDIFLYVGLLSFVIVACQMIIVRIEIKRYLPLYIFYFLLLLTIIFLNAFKLWPFGAYRVNLFLYSYICIFIFVQISFFKKKIISIVLAGILFLVEVQLLMGLDYQNLRSLSPARDEAYQVWRGFKPDQTPYIEVKKRCESGTTIIMMNVTFSMYAEYMKLVDLKNGEQPSILFSDCVSTLVLFPEEEGQIFEKTQAQIESANVLAPVMWYLYAGQWGEYLEKTEKNLSKFGKITHINMFNGAGYFKISPSYASCFGDCS